MILLDVLYKPSWVFKRWGNRFHKSPFLFVLVAEFLIYLDVLIIDQTILLVVLGMLLGLIPLLFMTSIYAILLAVFSKIYRINIKFFSLLSAMVLCELPTYIGSGLTMAGIPALSFSRLFISSPIEIAPFLGHILATITPFYIWSLVLRYIAITSIVTSKRSHAIFLIAVFAIVDLFAIGLLKQIVLDGLSSYWTLPPFSYPYNP